MGALAAGAEAAERHRGAGDHGRRAVRHRRRHARGVVDDGTPTATRPRAQPLDQPGRDRGNRVDDDDNGYVEDIPGIDTVDDHSDPRDYGGLDTLAQIVRTTKAECTRVRRRVACTITAEGAGTAKVQLSKRGRTLARGSGRIGRTIRLSRRVKPGRYQLRIAITDSASGRSQTIAKAVRVR